MSRQSMLKLGQIYGNMLNQVSVVNEQTLPTKPGPGAKELNDKDAAKLQQGGPSEKGGFKPAEIDTNKLSKKQEDDNLYNIKNLSYSDEDEESVEKMAQLSINNFMSKSTFDKLYENVMMGGASEMDAESMELDALGIDDAGDEAGDEMGGDEDTVTLTLPRALAKELHDALMPLLGGDEDMGEEGDLGDEEGGLEDEGGSEEEGNPFGEEDEEEMGHAIVNAKKPDMGEKGGNKVNMKLKVGSGKGGDGKYTDTVDGDAGAIKAPDMGKNNKVPGQTKTGKVGSDLFAQ